MRTVKAPEERREEILNAAEQLFMQKGYAKATINDILNIVQIAKGTFYYYFRSKEEVMDAIILRVVQRDYNNAKAVADDPHLHAHEKLKRMIMAIQLEEVKEGLLEQFHQHGNAEMHQKSLVQSILTLAPLFGDVVRQGITEGVFDTDHPQAAMEILLSASNFLFDDHLFGWTREEKQQRMHALVDVLERALGARKGSMEYIISLA